MKSSGALWDIADTEGKKKAQHLTGKMVSGASHKRKAKETDPTH